MVPVVSSIVRSNRGSVNHDFLRPVGHRTKSCSNQSLLIPPTTAPLQFQRSYLLSHGWNGSSLCNSQQLPSVLPLFLSRALDHMLCDESTDYTLITPAPAAPVQQFVSRARQG